MITYPSVRPTAFPVPHQNQSSLHIPTRLADPKLDIDSSLKRDFGVSQTRSISAADGLVRFGRLFAAGPTDFSSLTWNLLELLPLHTDHQNRVHAP